MFSDIKKQHLIVFFIMLAMFFGGGVKYGLYLSRITESPVVLTEKPKTEALKDSGSKKSSEVVVHVVGAVKKPGVFVMKEGDRVVDAVNQALPLPQADLNGLNLAEKLSDQKKIPVPYKGESPGVNNQNEGLNASSGAEPGNTTSSGTININTAGESELDTLSGIGPSKAKAIIQYREENGPFTSVEDIQKVSGIGPGTFDKIKDQITI